MNVQSTFFTTPTTPKTKNQCVRPKREPFELPEAKDGEQLQAYVTAVKDMSGLLWMPDDSTTKPTSRYLFGIAVYIHP
jgi:hypothetical protein